MFKDLSITDQLTLSTIFKKKKITDLKEMSTWLFIPKGTFHFVLLFDSIAKRKSNSKINLRWQYVALTNETIKSYWQVESVRTMFFGSNLSSHNTTTIKTSLKIKNINYSGMNSSWLIICEKD